MSAFQPVKSAGKTLGVLLASVPLAVVATFMLGSVWKWLEATHGIESWGHSGPAEWCYAASYVGCVLLLAAIAAVVGRSSKRGQDG